MAAILHLETERARQVLQRLKRLAFEMEQITSVLGNEARRLNAVWDGPSSEEFLTQFHIWHQQWRRLPKDLLQLVEKGFHEIEEWEEADRHFGNGMTQKFYPATRIRGKRLLPPLNINNKNLRSNQERQERNSPFDEWMASKEKSAETANTEKRTEGEDVPYTTSGGTSSARLDDRPASSNTPGTGESVASASKERPDALFDTDDYPSANSTEEQLEQAPLGDIVESNATLPTSGNLPNGGRDDSGIVRSNNAEGGGSVASGPPGTSVWDPAAANQGQGEVASAAPSSLWGDVDPLMGEALHDQVEPLSEEAPTPKGTPRRINLLLIGTGLIGGTALAGTAYYLFRSQQGEQETEVANPTQVVPDDTIAYWQQWMNEDLPDEAIEEESTLDANTQISDVDV